MERLLRYIPYLRRHLFQRDSARAESYALRREVIALKLKLEAAQGVGSSIQNESDELRGLRLRNRARSVAFERTFFAPGALIFSTKLDDENQNRLIGKFRDYIGGTVKKGSAALEIGPSYGPILQKRAGYNVSILDHTDQPGLVAKYSKLKVDTSLIESVDYIWRDGSLLEILGDKKFNAIVASHVIEHAPDFVQFLLDCSSALVNNGLIYLLVPDRRYCFDYFQPLSDPAKIIADHTMKRARHSFESFYRASSTITNAEVPVWGQHVIKDPKLFADPNETLQTTLIQTASSEYEDAHANFFTPNSFALIIGELRYLRKIDLEISVLTRSRGCEFLVVLKKSADFGQHGLGQFLDAKLYSHALMIAEETERAEFATFAHIQQL